MEKELVDKINMKIVEVLQKFREVEEGNQIKAFTILGLQAVLISELQSIFNPPIPPIPLKEVK